MITTITGSNDFAMLTELSKRIAEARKAYGDMAIERLDGSEVDYERLHEAVQSLPFLSERKLVVLDTPSQSKKFNEQIDALLESVSDSVDVIINEPKLDKRSSYYKTLKKETDFQEFNELDGSALGNWAVSYVAQLGGKLSLGNANFLISRVGASQQLLKNELDKLFLYQPEITRETIELLSEETPQSSIFELLDAALRGDLSETTRLYKEQRALKVEPQQIIAMLAWQLHILALVKTAGERSAETISSDAKLSPFVVRKCLGLVRQISFEQLKQMVSNALNLDVRLKTESLDPDESLQYYLLTIRN